MSRCGTRQARPSRDQAQASCPRNPLQQPLPSQLMRLTSHDAAQQLGMMRWTRVLLAHLKQVAGRIGTPAMCTGNQMLTKQSGSTHPRVAQCHLLTLLQLNAGMVVRPQHEDNRYGLQTSTGHGIKSCTDQPATTHVCEKHFAPENDANGEELAEERSHAYALQSPAAEYSREACKTPSKPSPSP